MGAPADSPKARNDAQASYAPGNVAHTDPQGMTWTAGTCSGVYCHSGLSVSTGPVPEPGVDFDPVRGTLSLRLSYAGSEVDMVLALKRMKGFLASR